MIVKKVLITRLSIGKTGFLSGFIFCILGLITGLTCAISAGVSEGLLNPASAFLFPGLGLWAIALLLVLGFAVGFLLGVIAACCFNLAGRLYGGLDIIIAENRK